MAALNTSYAAARDARWYPGGHVDLEFRLSLPTFSN